MDSGTWFPSQSGLACRRRLACQLLRGYWKSVCSNESTKKGFTSWNFKMPRKNQAKRLRSTIRTDKEQGYAVQMEHCIADSPFTNLERLQNFPLYTPRQDLTNFLVRYEIFKRMLAVHGSIIQC